MCVCVFRSQYIYIYIYIYMSGFINPHTRQFPLQVLYSLEKLQCRRIFVGFS